MTAVGQVHAEYHVAGLERGHVHRDVSLRAGMGLNVGMLGPEQRLGAVNRELLGFIREFAAAVIALSGVALGVLVGEDRAHGFKDGFRNKVLRGDKLDAG